MLAALLLAAGFLGASALPPPDSGAVAFADPRDPVIRVLYPRLDPSTGFTPVAEPEVGAGRAALRPSGAGDCQAGFRIAEPRTKDWTLRGTTYLLAAFLVTTDSKPGLGAPCYRPEPWVCVLEKKPAGALQPVDCLKVEPDVFPEELSLDTARFTLNEAERAFGVRFRNETHWRWGSETDAALVLLRVHDRRLQPILAVQVAHEVDDFDQGAACARELVLRVEKTRTNDFFDWTLRVGKKRGPGVCKIADEPVGTYRWDGARYVKAAAGKK